MNTREILARRRTTGEVSRMVIPVDADTRRRLERVVRYRLELDAGLTWYRRLLRWIGRST